MTRTRAGDHDKRLLCLRSLLGLDFVVVEKRTTIDGFIFALISHRISNIPAAHTCVGAVELMEQIENVLSSKDSNLYNCKRILGFTAAQNATTGCLCCLEFLKFYKYAILTSSSYWNFGFSKL